MQSAPRAIIRRGHQDGSCGASGGAEKDDVRSHAYQTCRLDDQQEK